MEVRPNDTKSSHFSPLKCFKNDIFYRELLETCYIHLLETILGHIFWFGKFRKFLDFFLQKKMLTKYPDFPNSLDLKKKRDGSLIAHSLLRILLITNCIYL